MNPLKHRIDSCDFTIDQLLLGTLLFTLITFLLPTTAIYFLFFSLISGAVALSTTSLQLTLMLLNVFPIFSVWPDSQRPPGELCDNIFDFSTEGVCFDYVMSVSCPGSCSYFRMKVDLH